MMIGIYPMFFSHHHGLHSKAIAMRPCPVRFTASPRLEPVAKHLEVAKKTLPQPWQLGSCEGLGKPMG